MCVPAWHDSVGSHGLSGGEEHLTDRESHVTAPFPPSPPPFGPQHTPLCIVSHTHTCTNRGRWSTQSAHHTPLHRLWPEVSPLAAIGLGSPAGQQRPVPSPLLLVCVCGGGGGNKKAYKPGVPKWSPTSVLTGPDEAALLKWDTFRCKPCSMATRISLWRTLGTQAKHPPSLHTMCFTFPPSRPPKG